ncbi:MAG: phosphonoacetaldehyde hydrolase, partial [Ralstonia mannitolilytica]
ACRPHYEIDTIADLPAVVADINHRLARGERPQGA